MAFSVSVRTGICRTKTFLSETVPPCFLPSLFPLFPPWHPPGVASAGWPHQEKGKIVSTVLGMRGAQPEAWLRAGDREKPSQVGCNWGPPPGCPCASPLRRPWFPSPCLPRPVISSPSSSPEPLRGTPAWAEGSSLPSASAWRLPRAAFRRMRSL